MPGPTYRQAGVIGGWPWEGPLEAGAMFDPGAPPGREAPTGPGAFTGVTREDVYRGAEERAADPSMIHQRGASLCGPACLMYLTAKHKPRMYETYVKELFEEGEAGLGGLEVAPGRDCRRHAPGMNIEAADWVALAGLRDSENAVFDYDDWQDQAAGITLPGELASWMKRSGCREVRNETNLYFTKGRSNFREAVDFLGKGCAVCLFINADVIQGPPPGRNPFSQAFSVPNHWVVLTGVSSTGEDEVRIQLYTWGDDRFAVPPVPGAKLRMKDWLQNYYGYVCCRV